MSRCDYSDLPAESCGHCTGADLGGVADTYYRTGSRDVEARYEGLCGHCEQRYRVGEVITLAAPGDGSERLWCLSSHVRRRQWE